jgi:phytoene desaturase
MRKDEKVVIIWGWIWWLSSAIYLAHAGYDVSIYEKNDHVGGRASLLQEQGYTFDMGPSRYLMPDVFEKFYKDIGENIDDHLHLTKLSPSYRIFFTPQDTIIDVAADIKKDLATFEKLEPWVSPHFKEYLKRAEYQYTVAMQKFVYKNYDSILDFFSIDTAIQGMKLNVFQKMSSYVKKFFKTDEMQKIVSYPLLFLGTSPYDALAIYSIMSHVDFNQWVFYPQWGLYEIIRSFKKIAEKHWVKIYTNSPVKKITTENSMSKARKSKVTWIELVSWEKVAADIVISNADMRHTETQLLQAHEQTYPIKYWEKKTLAPSAYILYLGIDGKLPMLTHHNLIFTKDWQKNFDEIFKQPVLPTDPSLYICKSSETDNTVAPAWKENLFVLVPCAPWLELTEAEEVQYTEKVLDMIADVCHVPDLKMRIEYQKLFHMKHFAQRYNAYKGTALGIAHTLMQTAVLRPNNYSKKVAWLYYTGAFTNPGIGTQMCLISGELTAERVIKRKNH